MQKITLCMQTERLELTINFKLYNRYYTQEIISDDINLAVKLNETLLIGIDSRERIINELQVEINRKELVKLVDEDSVLIRYPPDMLLQRTHTYVPGHDAYPFSTEVAFLLFDLCICIIFFQLSSKVTESKTVVNTTNESELIIKPIGDEKKTVSLQIPEGMKINIFNLLYRFYSTSSQEVGYCSRISYR